MKKIFTIALILLLSVTMFAAPATKGWSGDDFYVPGTVYADSMDVNNFNTDSLWANWAQIDKLTDGTATLEGGDLTGLDSLQVSKIGAYTLYGKLTAGAIEIEGSNFDVNGGAIDGTTIGASSASTGAFSTLASNEGIIRNDDASALSGIQVFEKSRSGGVITTADVVGSIIGMAHDGTDYHTGVGKINFVSSGTIGSNRTPGEIQFWAASDVSTSVPMKKVVIDAMDFELNKINLAFNFVVAPGAVTIGSITTGGGVNDGNHYYKVTYVTSIGETNMGTISLVATTGAGNNTVNLTSIPVSGELEVTSRKIYRTKAGASNYYLLVDLGDNSTTTYADIIADGSLGVDIANLRSNTTSGWLYVDSEKAGFIGKMYNVSLGKLSLQAITTGYYNVGIGESSLTANTTGKSNVAIGSKSMQDNTSGYSNTAIGKSSLQGNVNGYYNCAFGETSLLNNTGHNNTAVGTYSLITNTTGNNNVGIGYDAMNANLSGNNNVGIGYESGFSSSTGSGNIFIGYQAGYNETGSNKLYIDNSNTTAPLIYGDFDGNIVTINGNVGIGTVLPQSLLDQAKFSADAISSYHTFSKSRHATSGSHTIVQDNDAIGGVKFAPSDGVDFGTISAQILAEVDDAAPAASSIGGALVFSTAAGVGADDLTERMRIDKSGVIDVVGAFTAGSVVSDAQVTATTTVSGATYGSNGSVTDAELLYVNTLSSNAQDQLNLKAPLASPTFTGLVKRSVTATITAATPGGQGDGALTSDINEISVCGTASDAVTLPTAVAGLEIFIINNGAQILEIWPATGDDLGAGVNTATTLAAAANITFCSYNATNWEMK
uniref:Putative tail protein n=1 Tax=viral metagenome TaxID=1070528 RepID=A0A6H1ZTI9_9ZZZZ